MSAPEAGPIRVERVIRAPREDVFDAWTDPGRLRSWWGPPGVPVSRLDGELRPGSAYRIAMVEPTGNERVLEWTFREVDPPRRLVYGWRWLSGGGDDSLVVVEFTDLGDRTRVSVEHSGLPAASRDVHERGWIGCLDALVGQY
jgi:glutathione S-transferase